MRRTLGVVLALVVAAIMAMIGQTAQAAPAPAAAVTVLNTEQNGICEVNEVCLYFNSDCKGSLIDFDGWIDDFAGYKFLSAGNGKGAPVKNNAACARNLSPDWTARIWFNSDQKGVYDNIAPRTAKNLQKTYNENASLSWYK